MNFRFRVQGKRFSKVSQIRVVEGPRLYRGLTRRNSSMASDCWGY